MLFCRIISVNFEKPMGHMARKTTSVEYIKGKEQEIPLRSYAGVFCNAMKQELYQTRQ